MLQIRQLRKSFAGKPVLRDMSFSVRAGERVALLGPNGAGKTTLIRCLSGRVRPDAGDVELAGRDINRADARDRLGWVPQEIAVYGELTMRENLMAFGRLHGLRSDLLRQRVDWALHWTGLQSRADDFVHTFSGGMKRRVNLSCGVLHQPDLVLLDEPTVGVDPQSRQRIFAMLEELNRQGMTILLTTHHLDEAQTHSDRIVIVDAGQVVADGTFAELVSQTIGTSRLVKLRVDQPTQSLSSPSSPNQNGNGRKATMTARIQDVGGELPGLLEAARRQGFHVHDIDVETPSLHHVFLHLTGHELRDE